IEMSVLVGANPLIPVARGAVENDTLGENLPDFLAAGPSAYRALLDGGMAADFPDLAPTDEELDALAAGAMALGEISGLSDGLVFADSAAASDGFLADGATLVTTRTVDLSHLDVLLASPALGQVLIDQSVASDDDAWLADLGARYVAADTLGWVAEQLARGEDEPGDDDDSADPGDDDDSADPGDDDDSADPGDDYDSASGEPDVPWTGCGCSSASTTSGSWLLLGLALCALGARRRL
ncbi:MAG: hypothetical protein KDA24_30245, partial [Deltaproteobacteria bacterium]|nr:hypothetical protein [Deltaproteobacteria bacterium]